LKTWESVVKQVQKFEENKEDVVQNTNHLVMDYGNGKMAGGDNTSKINLGDLTDWSQTQLYSLLGMPGRYFKKLYENKDFTLVADHVNHHLNGQGSRDLFIRTRKFDEQSAYIRGVLSDRYTVFDNIDLIEILDKIFGNTDKDYNIEYFLMDETVFHLRLTFPDLTADVGQNIEGEQDLITAGVHISNSEVGKRRVMVEPMAFRLICSNGLMGWTSSGDVGFKQRHIWLNKDEMYNRVAEGVGSALKASSGVIDLVKMARSKPVENPLNVIDEIIKDNNFTKQDGELVRSAFLMEPENTVYGLSNAFTRAAKDMVGDKMVEFENLGGKVLVKNI